MKRRKMRQWPVPPGFKSDGIPTPASGGNHPGHLRAIVSLYDAIDAAEEALFDHGEDCGCSLCGDFRGLIYFARVMVGTLDSATFLDRDYQQVRRREALHARRRKRLTAAN